MEVSFEGIGQVAATFMVNGDIQPAMAVALTGDSTGGLGKAGDAVCGVALSAKNGMAAVQIGGMVKVGWSGTAPAIGVGTIAVDGTGKIKTVTSGGMGCLIVSVNTDDSTAVIKL